MPLGFWDFTKVGKGRKRAMGLRTSRSGGERGWTCPHTLCWMETRRGQRGTGDPRELGELGGRRVAHHRDQAVAASHSWSPLSLAQPGCPLVQHSCKRQSP